MPDPYIAAVRKHFQMMGLAGPTIVQAEHVIEGLREASLLKRESEVYPRKDGDFTVIGPECFASEDGRVISWRGANYVQKTLAETIPQEEEPHIDTDDPRYDGFRINEYWIATARAPDNQEAMLWVNGHEVIRYHLAGGPAMAADERRLAHLREYAQDVAETHHVDVHIRHFVSDGKTEVFTAREEAS